MAGTFTPAPIQWLRRFSNTIKKAPASPPTAITWEWFIQLSDPVHGGTAFESAIKVKPDSPAAQAAQSVKELAGT
jgi:hypothetical protein